MLQLALAIKKKDIKREGGISHKLSGELVDSLKGAFGFELTGAQKKAIFEIERDMSSGKMMTRLLEGDVGSGKTAVAAYALALAVQNGFQGVIMAPTEVLARQHFINLSELMMPLGVNVELLVGGMDASSRSRIYSLTRSGEIDILVGTHAVIQEGVAFKSLAIAVIDEQHKFGVDQRASLKSKGYNPHILMMTATPIPRTLAMTVYGDLDVSVIREMPKGRRPVSTYWIGNERRQKAYDFIKEELGKGRQAYIVYPLIDKARAPKGQLGLDMNTSGANGAKMMFERLRTGEFRDYKVELLHGRMSAQEKDRIMKNFKKGNIDVLVSTVVIEVGIDVPNATVMLIEDAGRFGLSQLHQLRGRVGRGEHESYCILIADPSSEGASRRLRTLEETTDGFKIAEADLDIRGPGEFFGTRQHGLPEIKFGNIVRDVDIMKAARSEAFTLVAADPELSEDHHRQLKFAMDAKFKHTVRTI